MRLAIISPYALDVHGGVQEQAMSMARELASRDHVVTLFSPLGDEVGVEGVSVVRFGRQLSLPANGSRAPITLSVSASRSVRREIDARQCDVVHLHEPFAPLLGYSELLAGRRPHVGTFHRSGGGPAYSLTTPLLRRFLRGLDVCVSVSDAAAETLREATGANSTVLFNGFSMDRFRSGTRAAHPTVLFIGRDEERKGLEVALRAHAVDPRRYDLVVVGKGTKEAVARAGSPSGVTALGPIDDEKKRELLGTASALVAPSLRGESFGLILIEAMASGTPVVASDIEGYRRAAGGHAELFAPGDAEGLNAALERALTCDEPQRAALISHAATYSMTSLVDRYEEIYRESVDSFVRR